MTMTRAPLVLALIAFVAPAAVAGCAADPDRTIHTDPPPDPGPPDWPRGLHVVGNHIQDGSDKAIVLHGVNRSGTEYKCVQTGNAMFDGPSDDASVQAITNWPKVNSVRVPLNESCWLGINGAPDQLSGDHYKAAIKNYVLLLHKYDLIPILELHWVGPGTTLATRQQPMPDADHAPAFWADVATTFLDDDGVILEPYNEPFPEGNKDNDAAWACWRDGCTVNQSVTSGSPATTYQAAGMQAIVDAIRGAGSTHVVLLGGIQYSNALTQWLAHKPNDPLGQLGAAWHLYNFNACVSATCWDVAPAAVAAAVPLSATEIGEDDCMGIFITPLMQWLDAHGAGYLAWSWNAFGACMPAPMPGRGGRPWSLINSYVSGDPNGGYAQTFRDHVAGM
jgi:endoglucanase